MYIEVEVLKTCAGYKTLCLLTTGFCNNNQGWTGYFLAEYRISGWFFMPVIWPTFDIQKSAGYPDSFNIQYPIRYWKWPDIQPNPNNNQNGQNKSIGISNVSQDTTMVMKVIIKRGGASVLQNWVVRTYPTWFLIIRFS